ncbi:MAG TPA: ribonuclease H-like domain-containing protein [Candidatus Margulisiibacteriota bacterium]|nr:ribonuclease H-like domain-containing protein [Candidatus Margulisiibacteriota bacterium]
MLVFDIETIADLTPATHDAVAALARDRDMTAEHFGSLCPPLARVVCIAWLDLATQDLRAVFDATLHAGTPQQSVEVEDGCGAARPARRCALQACGSEAQLLGAFGEQLVRRAAQPNPQLVTYNGRGFDLPVLAHRMLKHGVPEGRDLVVKAARDNRYNPVLHIDLMDIVTFGGAAPRWPMAAYAIGFGFRSPKHDMDGSTVWPAVQGGRILDVVRYCAGDVLATAHVYRSVYDLLPIDNKGVGR